MFGGLNPEQVTAPVGQQRLAARVPSTPAALPGPAEAAPALSRCSP